MRTPLWLFLFGLSLRLLFWAAGPDGGAAWHIGFQSDAPIWQEQAGRLAAGALDAELRLPWRPPGMLWLVSTFWDGAGSAWPLRLSFVVAGALVGPLVWALLRGLVERGVAVLAGALCAAASNLLLVSSGLHVEGLYLAGLLASLLVQRRMLAPHRLWLSLVWGGLHGALCLLRAEHLLMFLAFGAVAAVCRVPWRSLAAGALALVGAVAPWQVRAAGMVAEFNDTGPAPPALTLPWDEAAVAAVDELPAFARSGVYEVVDATVRHRGGARVGLADLAIVREAYGCWPEPLSAPWIALYGPLNFFVANAPEAARGGTWDALDRPPALAGGAERYPAWLRPRPGEHRQFSLAYPPHLDKVVHGYARGLAEALADPGGWAGRLSRKYWYALDGATGGLGGYALPIGLSGERRPVDLVAPRTSWAAAWRVGLALLALAGLWRLRRVRALWPLFAYGVLKLGVIGLFFGQARHGVLLLPAVATGVAVALAGALRSLPRARLAGVLLAGALVALEAARALTVTATVDGHPVTGLEPFGPKNFAARTIEFR